MKHKTSDLENPLLDAAVAKACVYDWRIDDETVVYAKRWGDLRPEEAFCPSLYWDHGGPIIERERISVDALHNRGWWAADAMSCKREGPHEHGSQCTRGIGPTPLIAAMRAYVASRFGEEVELP